MKWLKRLLLGAAFLIVFAAVAGFIAWHMFRGVPDWYARRKSTPQQLEAAYEQADKQIQRLVHDAQEAQHRAAVESTQPASASDQDAQPIQVALSDDELNSYFQKWDQALGWSHQYGSYLSNPQIVIQNGRLILAADVKEVGTVVSVAFEPKLTDGKLDMPVTQVLAGRLPLPESFWRRDVHKLDGSLNKHLPEWQDNARIARDGGANAAAIKAGMTELLMDLLNGKPADPVLFLPYDLTKMESGLPVRLTEARISDHTLTLTVVPLSAKQRQRLLSRIKTDGTGSESDGAEASR